MPTMRRNSIQDPRSQTSNSVYDFAPALKGGGDGGDDDDDDDDDDDEVINMCGKVGYSELGSVIRNLLVAASGDGSERFEESLSTWRHINSQLPLPLKLLTIR